MIIEVLTPKSSALAARSMFIDPLFHRFSDSVCKVHRRLRLTRRLVKFYRISD